MIRKELKPALQIAVIAGLLASACSEARGNNQAVNTAEKPGVTAPVDSQLILEPETQTPTLEPWTATPSPTNTPEPTATFEPTPEPFTEGQEVGGVIEIEGVDQIMMDFTPVGYSAENLSRFVRFEGNLTLVTWEDKYRNEVYAIHDGQASGRELPAEALRQFLEEFGLPNAEQMARLAGARVTFDQNGKLSVWRVAALQKVEHDDLPVFLADMWSVVDRLIEFTVRDRVTNEFEVARAGGGKIFIFCGRTDDYTQPDWYKYTRYTMLLLPVR